MEALLERVLYVEDDPDIRAVGTFALESVGGFTVKACGSGAEAVASAPAFRPQLVLLDVMMPEMDGPATLQALRAIEATATVPAMFMTAKAQPKEIALYLEMGAIEVIRKPFDPMTLGATLRTIWERVG
jgi:two-component system OmpR family response regulator